MGDCAGDCWVKPVDQQHPFGTESHSLGLKAFAHSLRAEGKGRRHMPVVVVRDDSQGFGGHDAQNGQHTLHVLLGRLEDRFGAATDVFSVIINRDQVFNDREPFKTAVLVNEFLGLGAQHRAGLVPNFERKLNHGPGREVIPSAATGEDGLADDVGARLEVHGTVGAAAFLVNFAEEDPYVVYLIDAAGDHGEFYPVREIALRFGLGHLDIPLIGTGNRRP